MVSKAIESSITLKNSMNVCEYGAGTGLLSLMILPSVDNITAIDSSKGMIDVFNQKIEKLSIKNINTIIANDFELDEKFDVIMSSMTLHHIENSYNILKKFFGKLNSGGYIAIADLYSEDGSFHPTDITGVYHYGFDPDELKKICENIGFSDISYKKAHTMTKNGRGYDIFLLIAKRI
jgi:2-polyprenyl-3-methyl-5-hydroxy-6-metoxy-1,4-benzoquinol methylase